MSVITKLESEFRVRFTKLEQDHRQAQVSEALEKAIPEISDVDVSGLPKQTDQFNSEISQVDSAHNDNANIEPLEDKEMDAFLDEMHNNKVSDEIRKKKLLHELANQTHLLLILIR